jgi:hypothetical protein
MPQCKSLRQVSFTLPPASCDTVAQVQTTLQKRILRAFVGRWQLENFEAERDAGVQTQRSRWMPGVHWSTTVQALS